MLSCLKPLPPTSTENYFSSPASQGYSIENTPRPSAQHSPIINLTREYTLAVQTDSYGEIRKTFDQDNSVDQTEHVDIFEEPQVLEQVLRPSREHVQETLSLIKPNPLTHLVATYFGYSEDATRLCFLLYQSVRRARILYAPIHNLLDDLPHEFDFDSYSLSHSQCNLAYNTFLQFDSLENPFLSPDSQNFLDMRQCFSDLREQLDHHVQKSRSVPLLRCCSTKRALCLIAAGVGVAVSGVAIAAHFLVALVGTPICLAFYPSNKNRKEKVHLPQLDAAAMNAFVLQKDLDTIERLVAHMYADVENDKLLIRLRLERGIDSCLIQAKLTQLKRNRPSFVQRLGYLEDHLFLCFAAINRTRSRLLQEIHLHQNPSSSSPE